MSFLMCSTSKNAVRLTFWIILVLSLIGCGVANKRDADSFDDQVSLEELGHIEYAQWKINRTLEQSRPHGASVEICLVSGEVRGLVEACDFSEPDAEALQLDYSTLTITLLAESNKIGDGLGPARGDVRRTHWECMLGLFSSNVREPDRYNICASELSVDVSSAIAAASGTLGVMFASRSFNAGVDFRSIATLVQETDIVRYGAETIDRRLAGNGDRSLSVADRERIATAFRINPYLGAYSDKAQDNQLATYSQEFSAARTEQDLVAFINKYRGQDTQGFVERAERRLARVRQEAREDAAQDRRAVRQRGTTVCMIVTAQDLTNREFEVLVRAVTEDEAGGRLQLRVSSIQELSRDRSRGHNLNQINLDGEPIRPGGVFWSNANGWSTRCL